MNVNKSLLTKVTIVVCTVMTMYNIAIESTILTNIYSRSINTSYMPINSGNISAGIIENEPIDNETSNLDVKEQKKESHDTQSLESPLIVLPELIQQSTRIMYIHIGKTGGTSLDKVLLSNCAYYGTTHPFREMCYNYHDGMNEIRLSNLTRKTVHLWRPDARSIGKYILNENITSLLFTIRNPISRVISAFNIEHTNNTDLDHLRKSRWGFEKGMKLKKMFYNQCFPTVEDLALTLARKRNATYVEHDDDVPHDCYDLGLKAIQGKGSEMQGGHHLRYNYQFYMNQVKRKYATMNQIFVIRAENLWNDTEALNRVLGGKDGEISNEVRQHHFTYGSEKKAVNSGLSKEGKRYICCHLFHENEIFETLVKDAVNIIESEKVRYSKSLYNDCGLMVSGKGSSGDKFIPFDWKEWEVHNCNF